MAEEWDAETIAFAHRMFDLARDGAAGDLQRYLGEGLPVNLTNEKGDTLLLLAAYHNHPETVDVLLQHGADPARMNDNGQTALVAAVFRQSPGIVKALLAAGADPRGGSPDAFETAEFFGLSEMAALLKQ
jgi:uncharacterized protein